MIKKNLYIAVFFFLLAFGCKTADQHEKPLTDITGLWQSTEGPLLYEWWTLSNDSLLSGISFSINQGDTLLLEKMRFGMQNEKLHFFARVPDQNEEEEVGFELSKQLTNTWVFENAGHDYPNRIIYELKNDSTLYARIENLRGNKRKEFRFKRIQP